DTIAGVEEAISAGAALGVAVIPGTELSVRDIDPATGQRWEEHLLGFFLDPAAPALLAYLAELQRSREGMIQATLEALARLGVGVDPRRVAELAAGAVV